MATKKCMASLWLGDVPQDKAFVCQDGSVLKNIDELAATLRVMSRETFRHHVTGIKNDFSTWVRDVVGDVTLARQLQEVTTLSTAVHRTEKRLAWLRTRL